MWNHQNNQTVVGLCECRPTVYMQLVMAISYGSRFSLLSVGNEALNVVQQNEF